MPGPFSGDAQAAASKAFTLEIAGRDYLNPQSDTEPFINVTDNPIVWNDDNGNDVGSMSIVVYDPQPLWANKVGIQAGNEVVFRKAGQVEPIFAGNVSVITWRPGIVGRYAEVSVLSYDAWLDWRIVPRLKNKKDTSNGKTVRFNKHDDQIIKRMINAEHRGGPITTQGGFVHRTTHPSRVEDQMPKGFTVDGATLREAMEEIAEEANYDGLPRQFYVDYSKRLHYYRLRRDGNNGTNLNAAPFRITDQDYVAHVTHECEATTLEYWPMRERPSAAPLAGKPVWPGSKGLSSMTVTGDVAADGGTAVVANAPGYLPVIVDKDSNFTTANHAPITAGIGNDSFSFEYWLKPSDVASGDHRLWLTFGGDDDGSEGTLQSNGNIRVFVRGGVGEIFKTTGTPLAVIDQWYHVVVAHAPGTTEVYINGVSVAGNNTGGVCDGLTATSLAIFSTAGDAFEGEVQHIAVYADKMTAAHALEHFKMGRAIIPEGHTFTDDSESETHAVYIKGKNGKGSGFVSTGNGPWSHNKQEYITRKGCDTSPKKRKKGRAWLRRQEDHFTGSFVVTDPDHATGWRAGQVLFSDDLGMGFPSDKTYKDNTLRQPYEIVSVQGELSGGNDVRIDIEYGVLKRTLLRRLARGRRR